MVKLTELINWNMLEKKFDIASLTPNMDEKGNIISLNLELVQKEVTDTGKNETTLRLFKKE